MVMTKVPGFPRTACADEQTGTIAHRADASFVMDQTVAGLEGSVADPDMASRSARLAVCVDASAQPVPRPRAMNVAPVATTIDR